MQSLKIALFRDGRPGHEKQSRGIVQALQKYVDVRLAEVNVPHRPALTEFGSHLGYLLHLDRSFRPTVDLQTDLIIGTGSRTHIPMLSGSRNTRARVVTCMTPGLHLLHRFDLCFVPVHDASDYTDNIFYTVGPPALSQGSGEHDPACGLALIGGEDKRSHIWDCERLAADLEKLIVSNAHMRWTIAGSPRTPATTEDRLKNIAAIHANVSFVPFHQTEPGWLEQQYRTSGSVWVTADSISMVYEALSAGCRVGVLPIAWKKKNNKYQRSLHYLLKEKLIVSLEQFVHGAALAENRAPLDEADRCAKEILRRWWPKNLP